MNLSKVNNMAYWGIYLRVGSHEDPFDGKKELKRKNITYIYNT
jgi:hypothetical protein